MAPSLAFGRECLATENWRAGLPELLLMAHDYLANASPDRQAYFLQPGVWQDVRSVYEGGLLNFPENIRLRSEYARAATRCGQWKVAHEQFETLGEKVDWSVFGSAEVYWYLHRKAVARKDEAIAAPPAN